MSETFQISVLQKPSEEELLFFSELDRFNQAHAGPMNMLPLYVFARDSNQKIQGSLCGVTYWDWLYIEMVIVNEAFRGHGLGSYLLNSAEQEAIKRGCHFAHLDTFSFQALPFYQKHGYRVFGELDNFPGEHKRYYLMKNLI